MKPSIKHKNRIIELDMMRGIAVFFMFFDHFVYDVAFFMGRVFEDYPGTDNFFATLVRLGNKYWYWNVRTGVREIILFVFLGLIGICCSFSKNNIKRGVKLLIASLVLTLATFLIGVIVDDIDIMITFGVLHCAALTLLLIGIFEKFIKNKWFYFAMSVVMITLGVYFYLNCEYAHYKDNTVWAIIFNQIIGTQQYGSDFFPFLLYGGEIFAGVFLGKLLYKDKTSLFKKEYKNNVVTFIGRNSLVAYFVHQIVIALLLFLIVLIAGYHIGRIV